MIYSFLAITAIGHAVLWAALVNRLHGLGFRRRTIKSLTALFFVVAAVLPLIAAVMFWKHGLGWPKIGESLSWTALWCYFAVCTLACVWSAIDQLRLAMHPERRGSLIANHTTRVDLRSLPLPLGEGRGEGASESASRLLAPGIPTWLGRVPGNQVLDLRIHEKQLAIPRMPAGAMPLRIVHLSDYHMSGRIKKRYFEEVTEQVNALEADLITITGDLVEWNHCLDWLPDTMGRLRAAAGVYFVRGNHDRRVDQPRLLAAMADLGLHHLDGAWRQVTIRNTPIILAGNELPWFGPACDLAGCPPRDASGLPLRILVTHGPDQFGWAEERDFDLVLAGHNHGGQIRLPIVGALMAPSLSGTRYACGTFRRENTVLHVSRGTGSLFPVRWNCPPEIALLVLEPASRDGSAI